MRTLFILVALTAFSLLQAGGQIVPANPVNTQQISMPVFTLNPSPAFGATVQLSGNPGPKTIFYWVVANYPIGAATLSGPFAITNAPNTLSVSNFVQVAAILPTGATTYDVLKTSSTIPPSGACACAVATGVAPGTVTNDQSNSTGAYTVNPVNMNALGLTLQNEVQSAGVSHLILRQNGAFVADLSNPAGSATFGTLGSGTALGKAFHVGAGSSLDATGGGTIAATSVPFPSVTPGSNTGTLNMGPGGSMSPFNIGQVAGSQLWIATGFLPPVLTTSAPGAGGSFAQNHSAGVQYTYNSSLGETMASMEVLGTGCGVGGGCTVTLTAPTIPAGYTGYTAYSCDTSSGVFCATQRQLASANCVNITTNCVISIPGTGVAAPTTNSAWVQPPNVQASECPVSVIPFIFGQTNDGNYHTWAGMDTNTSNGNVGQLTFCKKVFFTDLANPSSTFQSLSEPISYNNAYIAMNHEAGVGTDPTNQDRLLGMLVTTPTNDSATRHAVEGIQLEADKNCNGCAYAPGPDSEFTALSLQLQDNSLTNTGSSLGTNVGRFDYYRAGAGWDAAGENIIAANFRPSVYTGFAGTFAGFRFAIPGASGTATGLTTAALWNQYAPSLTAGNGQVTVYGSGSAAGANNWFLFNGATGNLPSDVNGPLYFSAFNSDQVSTLSSKASVNVTGSLASSQAAAPNGPSVTCSGGASTYSYVVVGVDANGGTIASGQGNCTTGTNPLTVGNPATISASNTTASALLAIQFDHLDVYRTGGPMPLGKIGTLSCPGTLGITTQLSPGCTAFVDSGLTATGVVPAAGNTTGGSYSAGLQKSNVNTVQVASDFTSAANTSLQTITGLTWNLSQTVAKYSFHCSLNYSQATAAASMQFGIQVATAAPNSVDARGRVDTSATAVASGTLNGLATTTATPIVTFTPSAAATVFGAELDGTIDLPQNNAGNTVNIMVQTSNAADLPTVKRGSYCSIMP